VFAERIGYLPITSHDLTLDFFGVKLRPTRARVYFRHEAVDRIGDNEVFSAFLKRFDGARRAFGQPGSCRGAETTPRTIGILLRSRERKLLFDNRLVQDEPRVVISRRQDAS